MQSSTTTSTTRFTSNTNFYEATRFFGGGQAIRRPIAPLLYSPRLRARPIPISRTSGESGPVGSDYRCKRRSSSFNRNYKFYRYNRSKMFTTPNSSPTPLDNERERSRVVGGGGGGPTPMEEDYYNPRPSTSSSATAAYDLNNRNRNANMFHTSSSSSSSLMMKMSTNSVSSVLTSRLSTPVPASSTSLRQPSSSASSFSLSSSPSTAYNCNGNTNGTSNTSRGIPMALQTRARTVASLSSLWRSGLGVYNNNNINTNNSTNNNDSAVISLPLLGPGLPGLEPSTSNAYEIVRKSIGMESSETAFISSSINKKPASIGVNLRVTGQCSKGGREYMEDYFSVAYQETKGDDSYEDDMKPNCKELEYAYFGIFDGHGGSEAASFAKENLMLQIVSSIHFWSDDDEGVMRAIREGFIAAQFSMWLENKRWQRTNNGHLSTAGTTATVAFLRREKIYIGHVGDSAVVLGYQGQSDEKFWRAKQLTRDHKPDSTAERRRIVRSGGNVILKSGVPRVVWNRPRDSGHRGPITRTTPVDDIAFLAVARSLGDLWSFNSENGEFVVSPDPDVMILDIDSKTFKCLIFGTDGLWNALTPQSAVDAVYESECINNKLRRSLSNSSTSSRSQQSVNPSKVLVDMALKAWATKKTRADNISVVTVILYPNKSEEKNGGTTEEHYWYSNVSPVYYNPKVSYHDIARKLTVPLEFHHHMLAFYRELDLNKIQKDNVNFNGIGNGNGNDDDDDEEDVDILNDDNFGGNERGTKRMLPLSSSSSSSTTTTSLSSTRSTLSAVNGGGVYGLHLFETPETSHTGWDAPPPDDRCHPEMTLSSSTTTISSMPMPYAAAASMTNNVANDTAGRIKYEDVDDVEEMEVCIDPLEMKDSNPLKNDNCSFERFMHSDNAMDVADPTTTGYSFAESYNIYLNQQEARNSNISLTSSTSSPSSSSSSSSSHGGGGVNNVGSVPIARSSDNCLIDDENEDAHNSGSASGLSSPFFQTIDSNSLHEIIEEQQRYQQQEGYSLTKLETRREQQRMNEFYVSNESIMNVNLSHTHSTSHLTSSNNSSSSCIVSSVVPTPGGQWNNQQHYVTATATGGTTMQLNNDNQQNRLQQHQEQQQEDHNMLELHSLLQQEQEEERRVALEHMQQQRHYHPNFHSLHPLQHDHDYQQEQPQIVVFNAADNDADDNEDEENANYAANVNDENVNEEDFYMEDNQSNIVTIQEQQEIIKDDMEMTYDPPPPASSSSTITNLNEHPTLKIVNVVSLHDAISTHHNMKKNAKNFKAPLPSCETANDDDYIEHPALKLIDGVLLKALGNNNKNKNSSNISNTCSFVQRKVNEIRQEDGKTIKYLFNQIEKLENLQYTPVSTIAKSAVNLVVSIANDNPISDDIPSTSAAARAKARARTITEAQPTLTPTPKTTTDNAAAAASTSSSSAMGTVARTRIHTRLPRTTNSDASVTAPFAATLSSALAADARARTNTRSTKATTNSHAATLTSFTATRARSGALAAMTTTAIDATILTAATPSSAARVRTNTPSSSSSSSPSSPSPKKTMGDAAAGGGIIGKFQKPPRYRNIPNENIIQTRGKQQHNNISGSTNNSNNDNNFNLSKSINKLKKKQQKSSMHTLINNKGTVANAIIDAPTGIITTRISKTNVVNNTNNNINSNMQQTNITNNKYASRRNNNGNIGNCAGAGTSVGDGSGDGNVVDSLQSSSNESHNQRRRHHLRSTVCNKNEQTSERTLRMRNSSPKQHEQQQNTIKKANICDDNEQQHQHQQQQQQQQQQNLNQRSNNIYSSTNKLNHSKDDEQISASFKTEALSSSSSTLTLLPSPLPTTTTTMTNTNNNTKTEEKGEKEQQQQQQQQQQQTPSPANGNFRLRQRRNIIDEITPEIRKVQEQFRLSYRSPTPSPPSSPKRYSTTYVQESANAMVIVDKINGDKIVRITSLGNKRNMNRFDYATHPSAADIHKAKITAALRGTRSSTGIVDEDGGGGGSGGSGGGNGGINGIYGTSAQTPPKLPIAAIPGSNSSREACLHAAATATATTATAISAAAATPPTTAAINRTTIELATLGREDFTKRWSLRSNRSSKIQRLTNPTATATATATTAAAAEAAAQCRVVTPPSSTIQNALCNSFQHSFGSSFKVITRSAATAMAAATSQPTFATRTTRLSNRKR